MKANLQSIYSQHNSKFLNNLKLIDAIDFLGEYMENYSIFENIYTRGLATDLGITKDIFKRLDVPDYLKHCLIMASGLLLCQVKEKIIDHESNKVLINTEAFADINEVLTTKNGKVYIGDIEFDNAIDAMHILKNHLIHGAYSTTNTHVIINENGQYGGIDYGKLASYAARAGVYSRCNSKRYIRNLCLLDYYYDVPEYSVVDDSAKNNFKIKEYYIVLTAKGKRLVSSKAIYDLDILLNNLYVNNAISKTHGIVDNQLMDIKDYMEQNYKNLTVEIYEREISKELDDTLKAELSSNMFEYSTLDLVQHATDYTSVDNAYNVFIELLNFIEASMDIPDHKLPTNFRKAELARLIMKFYAYYNYGIDDLLADKSSINIMDVLEGTKFDYSIMDLTEFDDPNMEISRSLEIPSTEDLNDYLQSKLDKYNKFLADYEAFEETKSIEHKESLRERAESALNDYNKTKENINKISSFDQDKYVKNISIINHIRNCLSHGNYDLVISNYYDDDKNYFVFYDQVRDENNNLVDTYKCTVSVNTFKKLFNYTKEIRETLENNIPPVNDSFYFNEIQENPLIADDKRPEWKTFIKKHNNNYEMCRLTEMFINEFAGGNQLVSNIVSKEKYGILLTQLLIQLVAPALNVEENYELSEIHLKKDDYYELLYAVMYYSEKEDLLTTVLSLIDIAEKQIEEKETDKLSKEKCEELRQIVNGIIERKSIRKARGLKKNN